MNPSQSPQLPLKASVFTPNPILRISERLLTTFMRIASRQYLSLQPASFDKLPPAQPGHTYTLYTHVPFCETLCPYCSFNRFTLNQARARAYFKSMRAEMRLLADLGYKFPSLYIGGGTPTILAEELVETIDLARELFGVQEVSCETNPNHLTPAIIDMLKDRVQRLSVGVQSFDDGLLKQMERYEKYGSGDQIFESIRSAAPFFKSLNVDMIFNFPSQTPDILRRDLQRVIDSGAQQTTFYPLMSSPSVKKSMARSVGQLDLSREMDYYNIILQELSGAYTPMSAWTFARNGTTMIDEYIVDTLEYAAVGSGVFSYLDGSLYASTFSLSEYDQRVSQGRMGVNAVQHFSAHQQMRYRMMMDMFGLNFDRDSFHQQFGVPASRGLWLEMLFFNLLGAFSKADRAIPTPVGRYLAVVIMREFFSGVNRLRDISRATLTADGSGTKGGTDDS
jgi:menaquinone C8-methyltransferase